MKSLVKYFFVFVPVISVVLMFLASMFVEFPSDSTRFVSVCASASVLFLGLYSLPVKRVKKAVSERKILFLFLSIMAIATLRPVYWDVSYIILISCSVVIGFLFVLECIPQKVKKNQWVIHRKKLLFPGQRYIPLLDRNFAIIRSKTVIKFMQEFSSVNDYCIRVEFKAEIEVFRSAEPVNNQEIDYCIDDHINQAAEIMLIDKIRKNSMNSWFCFIVSGESVQGFNFKASIINVSGNKFY